MARRTWSRSSEKAKYLYQLEIDKADVRHCGDVNHFSDVSADLAAKRPATASIEAYWNSTPHVPSMHSGARVEKLVKKAVVVSREKPPP